MSDNKEQHPTKDRMTYLRMDESMHSRLREIADADQRPVAYLVRLAVEQYLNRRKAS